VLDRVLPTVTEPAEPTESSPSDGSSTDMLLIDFR